MVNAVAHVIPSRRPDLRAQVTIPDGQRNEPVVARDGLAVFPCDATRGEGGAPVCVLVGFDIENATERFGVSVRPEGLAVLADAPDLGPTGRIYLPVLHEGGRLEVLVISAQGRIERRDDLGPFRAPGCRLSTPPSPLGPRPPGGHTRGVPPVVARCHRTLPRPCRLPERLHGGGRLVGAEPAPGRDGRPRARVDLPLGAEHPDLPRHARWPRPVGPREPRERAGSAGLSGRRGSPREVELRGLVRRLPRTSPEGRAAGHDSHAPLHGRRRAAVGSGVRASSPRSWRPNCSPCSSSTRRVRGASRASDARTDGCSARPGSRPATSPRSVTRWKGRPA